MLNQTQKYKPSHCYLVRMAETKFGGLTSAQAQLLLEQDGPNELAKQGKSGPLGRIFRVLTEPMLLLLIAAGLVSLFLTEPIDAAADWLLVIVLAALSVSWFEIYKLAKRLLKTK